MKTFRQFLGGLAGGAVVVALIAGGLLLSAGDLNIAFRPPPTVEPVAVSSPTASPQPATATFLPTSTHTPTLFPTGTCPRPAGWVDHVVIAGENLASIAGQFNIDVALLQVNNCLVDAVVAPDQVIFVPPLPTDTPTATRVFTASPTVCGPPRGWPPYIVKAGDTLSSIARATGTTVASLKLANCLPSDKIRAGQVLYVPRLPRPIVTSTFTPTRTPTPSLTPTGSFTPTPSLTPSATQPTSVPPSATPTATPSPTETGTPVEVQSPTPTPTIDASPTATDTIPPTVSIPTSTPTPSPTL